jgi:molecular chaperone GrpE
MEIIDQLDDLERALHAVADAPTSDSWVAGVRLVAQKMLDTLSRNGVTLVETEGRRFDPQVHEAMLETEAPEGMAPGDIVQVVRKGYRRGPRVLRAARVVVARGRGEST